VKGVGTSRGSTQLSTASNTMVQEILNDMVSKMQSHRMDSRTAAADGITRVQRGSKDG